MRDAIIVAIITGAFTLVGVIITSRASNRKSAADFQTAQAVTNTKLDELTREVREHNNFARRMPVVEEQIKGINHHLDDVDRRLDDLEKANSRRN